MRPLTINQRWIFVGVRATVNIVRQGNMVNRVANNIMRQVINKTGLKLTRQGNMTSDVGDER